MKKKGIVVNEKNLALCCGHINRFLNKSRCGIITGTAHNVVGGTCVVNKVGFVDTLNIYSFRGHPTIEPRIFIYNDVMASWTDKYNGDTIKITNGTRIFNDGQNLKITDPTGKYVIINHVNVSDSDIQEYKIRSIVKSERDSLYFSATEDERKTELFDNLMESIQLMESTLVNKVDFVVRCGIDRICDITISVNYDVFNDESNWDDGIKYTYTYSCHDNTINQVESIAMLFRDVMSLSLNKFM